MEHAQSLADEVPPRRRMRWHWRLLTLKIDILAVFLLACMLGGCAMLFLNASTRRWNPRNGLVP